MIQKPKRVQAKFNKETVEVFREGYVLHQYFVKYTRIFGTDVIHLKTLITFIFFHNICLFMVHVYKTICENIFIYFE